MKQKDYGLYKLPLATAIVGNKFVHISRLLYRTLCAALEWDDAFIATYDWVKDALRTLAEGPHAAGTTGEDRLLADAFSPCSAEDAEKMSNYATLSMILLCSIYDRDEPVTDARVEDICLLLHRLFGECPTWQALKSRCFQLLFAEVKVGSGFNYTGELFRLLAEGKPVHGKLNFTSCAPCADRCQRYAGYLEFAQQFSGTDTNPGIGTPAAKIILSILRRIEEQTDKIARHFKDKGKKNLKLGISTIRTVCSIWNKEQFRPDLFPNKQGRKITKADVYGRNRHSLATMGVNSYQDFCRTIDNGRKLPPLSRS